MQRPETLLRTFTLCLLLVAPGAFAQQERLASDFEIAQMEKQLASSSSFESRLGAMLNLGDARLGRNEPERAREQFTRALELAQQERTEARRGSSPSLSRYANASSWGAIAAARIGRRAAAFALAEEAVRYAGDEPETWNLYASAMRSLRLPYKAASAARNALDAATRANASALDQQVYRHALAAALSDAGQEREARTILESIVATLRSAQFEELRRAVRREEAFEVYSSARGDVSAYVSLLNRAQLRLASMFEAAGETSAARAEYERVLELRSDDVTALTALARLTSGSEREGYFASAFDANPFSPALVEAYRKQLATGGTADVTGSSTGSRMRRALQKLARGERRGARSDFDALLSKHAANQTLLRLRSEADGEKGISLPSTSPTRNELLSLLNEFDRLTAEQRLTLDSMQFTGRVAFERTEPGSDDTRTLFAAGTIEGIGFRFSLPMAFAGRFTESEALTLTYRILGVTSSDDRDVLLLEPVKLERAR